MNGNENLHSEEFFAKSVYSKFEFLVSKYGYTITCNKINRMHTQIVYSCSPLNISFCHEPRAVTYSITYSVQSVDYPKGIGCSSQHAMLMRCPEEAGWPYSRRLSDLWPKSSDLLNTKVMDKVLENEKRVMLAYFDDVVNSKKFTMNAFYELTKHK
ncbi:hypothetical protein [Rubinisphaera italica]|uniref:Uncharacterized protein n=1 Tax=Rubinisphaera italica TaxID=2527969 RepID=A0A5C5XLN3_9PLAN|nr:hypothetical protein [Rubinisphaera italica]TWT63774.1 hypothetical protein Pan54_45320 [Rubinisphaera italica]